MACSVKVIAYTNPHALTVPAVAVFDDELDDDKHYVYKSGADKPEKRTVTIGKRSAGRAEITAGLEPGDEDPVRRNRDDEEDIVLRYLIWLLPLALSTPAIAADTPAKPPPPEPVTSAELESAIRRGVEFGQEPKRRRLLGQCRADEGPEHHGRHCPGRTGHFRPGPLHSPLPP